MHYDWLVVAPIPGTSLGRRSLLIIQLSTLVGAYFLKYLHIIRIAYAYVSN